MTDSLNEFLIGMKSSPWKYLSLNGEQYLSKFSASSSSYCFILSDLNSLYLEYLSSSEVERRFQELNPGLEMPIYRMVGLLEKLLHCSEGSEMPKLLNLVQNGNKEMLLKAEATVAGISFIWHFQLAECDKKLFKDQLLQPLIGMIAELQQRQNILISLIKNKDKEIEDYKNAGAKVSRKYLETAMFDENQFLLDRYCPQMLSETLKSSVNATFDQTDLYVAVATAIELAEEQQKTLDEHKSTADEVRSDANHSPSNPKEADEDEEITRRKELEKKLLSKPPAKKKKKIAF